MNPTERFSDRVEQYSKYRPSYPAQIIPFLTEAIGLDTTSVVADIGSGTGIFTELLLEHNIRVYAVEPNAAMRTEAERLLGKYHYFHSIDGTAEQTTLEDESVDIVTCAQAFHWFDPAAARTEFLRILDCHQGWVVLLWNDRLRTGSPFLEEYEALLQQHGTDYLNVRHRWGDKTAIDALFGADSWKRASFANEQLLDREGLLGRLLSSSYVPNSGERSAQMVKDFSDLFERCNDMGYVTLAYQTNVYYGQIHV